MDDLNALLDSTFLGTSTGQFAAAAGIFFIALIGRRLLAHLFVRILHPLTKRTQSELDDLFIAGLQKPFAFLILTLGLYGAFTLLQLPVEPFNLHKLAMAVCTVMATFGGGWILFNLVDLLDTWLAGWAQRTESTLDDHLLPFVRKFLKGFVVMMATLLAIQNLGYSVSGLLASLGIGGLAVALAAKDTLSNVFGSLMLILDRPFKLGDWIKAGDMEGTIEEIGFRSTRIRTFAKTQITVPNNVIANLPLDNFSRMPKRRIKLTIGLTYATTPEQMRVAVESIRELLRRHPAIDQEFFLVNFTDFGASSLDIMVYCFTTTTVWGEYLDARQDLCLQIMELLERQGLQIAFPSRSIYLHPTAGTPENAA